MFVRAHPFLRVIDDQIASAAYFLTAQDPWRQITPSGFSSLPHLKNGGLPTASSTEIEDFPYARKILRGQDLIRCRRQFRRIEYLHNVR